MTRLLWVTDHVFERDSAGEIADAFGFADEFFDDYRQVVDEVVVCGRTNPGAAAGRDRLSMPFIDLGGRKGMAWRSPWSMIAVRTQLRPAIASADVVCVRVPSIAGAVAASLAKVGGAPVLAEVVGDPGRGFLGADHGRLRGVVAPFDSRTLARTVQRADAVSYVTPALAGRFPSRTEQSDVISTARLRDADLRSPVLSSGNQGRLEVLVLGSLLPVKGHSVLFHALSELQGRLDFRVTVAGDGPLRRPLERDVGAAGLAAKVDFLGHVGRSRVYDVIDRADLVVQPSLSEGLPRSVLEAMLRGVPVLATRVGGLPELLRDDQLVLPGDVAGLREALMRAKDSDVRYSWAVHGSSAVHPFLQSVLSARRQGLLRGLL